MQSATGKFNPPPASLAPVLQSHFAAPQLLAALQSLGSAQLPPLRSPGSERCTAFDWKTLGTRPDLLAAECSRPNLHLPTTPETFWTLGSRENAIPGLSKPLKPPFPKGHTYIQKEPIAIVQKCRNEGAIHKFTMTTPPEDSVWRKSCKYTGCLTGILIMAYYNPLIIWQYNPLHALNNHAFFHCSIVSLPSSSSLLSSTPSYWFPTASLRPRLLQGSHKSRPYDKHGGVVFTIPSFFQEELVVRWPHLRLNHDWRESTPVQVPPTKINHLKDW